MKNTPYLVKLYLCKFITYDRAYNKLMKKFVILGIMLMLLILRWNTMQGQSYVMTNGQITTCSGTFYDPGGPNGDYGNNQNFIQTIQSNLSNSCLQISFTAFSLEGNHYDYLNIYDGNTTSSPLIGTFTGTYSPGIIVASSGALTFEFHSDNSVHYPGWTATITCVECPEPPAPPPSSTIYLSLCPDSSVLLSADGGAQTYLWSNGATTQSITTSMPGTYMVTATNNTGSQVSAFVVSAIQMNPIKNISIPEMCAGDANIITVGHDSTNNVYIGTHESVLTWTDTVFLPDGVYCEPYGCSYRSPLTFSDYAETDVITSADDILYIRLNMEHSYIGDLYINLTCPNGQKADILRYGGAGTSSCNGTIPTSSKGWQGGSNASGGVFLGQAYDYNSSTNKCDPTNPENAPGVGWNYCWSNNTTQGYTYAPGAGSLIYRSANVHNGIFDSSNVVTGTQFYHPDQSFSSLVGCPLNGDWYIEVVDGYSVDNGYLFEWELALSPSLQTIYTDVDSTALVGPWVETINDSTFIISPPVDLSQDTTVTYAIYCFDEFGCGNDTTVEVTFYALDRIYMDTVACDSLLWDGILYTESYSYSDTLTNIHGCDSIINYQLTVLNSSYTLVKEKACDSLEWNDVTYYESGFYQYLTQNQYGCDSLVTLDLTIHYSNYVDFYDTACDSYTWNDSVYVSSGDYTQVFYNQNHCDSVVTLHLTIWPSTSSTQFDIDCDSYVWNDSIYYESGTYVKHFVNQYGCDSTATLQLILFNSDSTDVTLEACDSLYWNEIIYYGSGEYTVPLQKANGCDSLMTLHLTVWNSAHVEVEKTACDYYYWMDSIYYETGNYSVNLQTVHGCDSIVTLRLKVFHSDFVDIYDTVCDSYFWVDTTYYQSGIYTKHFENAYNCDSTVVLHLTVWHSDTVELYDTVCNKTYWNGSTYYVSGDYTYLTENIHGCDSLVILHLTVYYSDAIDLFDTACDSFVWNDSTYYESGVYLINFQNEGGCDSVVALHLVVWHSDWIQEQVAVCDSLIWGDSIYYESGNYVRHFLNQHGCDSTVVLQLVIMSTTPLSWSDTVCDSLVWNDSIYYESGVYIQYFSSIDGCDSIVTLDLTVRNSYFVEEFIVVCDSALWNDSIYYESGDYTASLISESGCDSVVTLHLTVNKVTDSIIAVTVYENALPYILNGYEYVTDGIYTQTFTNSVGCDSLQILMLSVLCPDSALSVVTYGVDNSQCDGVPEAVPPAIPCNGFATAVAVGGIPPYSYQWDDLLAQTTDTAFYLCEGSYSVIVTDAQGDTASAHVVISNHAPKVNHDDGHFCFSDSLAVLHGNPVGGVYTGTTMNGDTLVFQEDVTDYQLTYIYTDSGNCTSITQFQVTVTMNTRTEDTMICSNALPFVWYGQSLTESGTYIRTAPIDTLCDSIITLHLTIQQQPQLSVSEDAVIDYGESTVLSVLGADSYEWSPAEGLSSVSSSQPVASPTHSTKYFVTGYSSAECFATDSVKVLIRQYLDTTICDNHMPLQWYGVIFSDTTAQTLIIPNPNGLEQVLILKVHLLPNSEVSISDTVLENDLPLIFNGMSFDENVTDTMIVITNSSGCDSVIHFSLYVCRNQLVTKDSVVCENELPLFWNNQELWGSGTYQADMYTACGSDSLVILQLSVIDTALSVVSLTEDFCEEMSAELTVITTLTDYLWSTGETTPQITVNQTGTYSVIASQGSCHNTGSIKVNDCEEIFVMPNAITPSREDGINDWFCVPENQLKNIYLFEISIFNRWGEQVFYSSDKHFKWNGEFKGEILVNNTYNYIIRYTNAVGKPFVLKGSVTVL